MKRSELFKLLAGLGAASSLVLVSCNDNQTGVPEEPDDLRVTKITYSYPDPQGNLPTIFGDSSAPRLCPGDVIVNGQLMSRADAIKAGTAGVQPIDSCDQTQYSDSGLPGKIPAPTADYLACCYSNINDKVVVLMGTTSQSFPISTDAVPAPPFTAEFRVVYNKVPTQLNGMDLETVTRDPSAPLTPTFKLQPGSIGLTCDNCTGGDGVPPNSQVLHVDGSYLSFDPTGITSGVQIPYGPALAYITNADPTGAPAGLEPSATYHFTTGQSLAGRNGKQIGQYDMTEVFLTTFKTEPFKINNLGIGDAAADAPYDGTNSIASLSNDGVITLTLNAPAWEVITPATIVSATFTPKGGTAMAVAAKIGISTTDGKTCDTGARNQVFLYPASGAWAPAMTTGSVSVTINAGNIFSLSWKSGKANGKGHANLGAMQTFTAQLSGNLADMKYTGQTSSGVASNEDCAGLTMTADMATPPDMASSPDMATSGDMAKTVDMAGPKG